MTGTFLVVFVNQLQLISSYEILVMNLFSISCVRRGESCPNPKIFSDVPNVP